MSNNYLDFSKTVKKIDLDDGTLDLIAPLLHQVDEAYKAYDCDLEQVENVLEKSSQELFQTNQQLKTVWSPFQDNCPKWPETSRMLFLKWT